MANRIAFWKHQPVADQTAESLAANTLLFYKQAGGDLVKLTPAGNYQIADRGGKADWLQDALGRRTFTERFIQQPADWLAVSAETTALEYEMVKAAKLTRGALPSGVPLFATLFCPATLALMLAGPQTFAHHLDTFPELVNAAIDRLEQASTTLLELYSAAGVTGFFLANQHATAEYLTEQLYQLHILPNDNRMLAQCLHYGETILHLHGSRLLRSAVPATGTALVHFELHPTNPAPEQFRALSQCEAVIGLPLSTWRQGLSTSLVSEMLTRFKQTKALFTAPCVVPLDIDNKMLNTWADSARMAFD